MNQDKIVKSCQVVGRATFNEYIYLLVKFLWESSFENSINKRFFK